MNYHETVFIETGRLYLTKLCDTDFENLARLFGDTDVMRYSVNGPCPREKVREILKNMLEDERKKQLGVYVVSDKKTKTWMGIVGVSWLEKDKLAVVYRFFKEFWRTGYATEALKALLDYITKNYSNLRIYAYIEKENIASLCVAEKVGMKFEEKTTFYNLPVLAYRYLKDSL